MEGNLCQAQIDSRPPLNPGHLLIASSRHVCGMHGILNEDILLTGEESIAVTQQGMISAMSLVMVLIRATSDCGMNKKGEN